jgi:two-component system sensor histidine kinase/response regulator
VSASSAVPVANVLVVDDVIKNLQVVGTMLRNAGYAVTPATSGAEALKGLRVRVPDLVLLDMMMPEMDGLEVCRRLKADPSTQSVPVIFLTANNEMEHLVKGFEVGAVDYVTKPFNAPELLARVRTHLELKQARDVIFRNGVELRRLNDEKNEFMGIAAHDLRSPLNAIKGYSEMVLEDSAISRENAELIQKIHEASARMAEMVQNLLDANRIDRGELKLSLAPTNLVPVLSSVVEAQRPRSVAKQQTIHLQSEATALNVEVDPNIIVQVLENLISNAVKYSPRGKSIFVRLKREGSAVRCEVRDEGPGLSADDHKKLFGKFARLSAKPTGDEHSTGLGLSIVKKMVEAMNGKVWCESELGRGATFIVTLPIEDTRTRGPSDSRPSSGS